MEHRSAAWSAIGPDSRKIPMAPGPGGVEMAAMVSVQSDMMNTPSRFFLKIRRSSCGKNFVKNTPLTDVMETGSQTFSVDAVDITDVDKPVDNLLKLCG